MSDVAARIDAARALQRSLDQRRADARARSDQLTHDLQDALTALRDLGVEDPKQAQAEADEIRRTIEERLAEIDTRLREALL